MECNGGTSREVVESEYVRVGVGDGVGDRVGVGVVVSS